MTIALSEFWTRLVRSGITDAAGCKQLAAAFSSANRGTPPSDAETLAKFMIKAGKLTSFQAGAMLANPPRELRAGGYLVQSPAADPPLSRWVGAMRVNDGRSGFLLRASAEELAGGRAQWLEAHQAIQGSTLQSLELEPFASSTLVFSPMPAGRSLHAVVRDRGSLPARVACEIGIAVADALDSMHARSLIHGAVRPDRVWIADDGSVILLRDPSGPPLTPFEHSSAGWIDGMDQAAAYAAPEFAGDGQVCNQATDIYSLGCLMFRLVSGRNPHDKDSATATIAAHATETPQELADAVTKGESGDPLYRVIAFAMAKNPASRFATAQQLASALRATLPLLPTPAPSAVETAAVETAGKTPKAVEKAAAPRQDKPKRQKSRDQEATGKARKTPAPKPAEPTASAAKDSPAPKPKRQAESKPQPESKPQLERARQSATPPPRSEPTASETSNPPAVPTSSPPPASSAPPAIAHAAPEADRSEDQASPSRPLRRRKKKKTKAPLVLGAMCIAILMLMIGLVVHEPSETVAEKKKRPPIPAVIPRVSNRIGPPSTSGTAGSEPASTSVAGYELASDDRLLFVPPYAADSPNAPLEFLPPGPRVIVSVRLASITESPLGTELMEALSPELTNVIKSVASRAKVPASSIERCSAAMHPGRDGWPEVTLAINLRQPRPASELIEQWQVAASRTPEGATIYAGDSVDSDAYFFLGAENESISQFAVGSVDRISDVAAAEGGAIPLTRTFASLWDGSSDQADLAVLITPNFLFADGRALLQSSAPELIRPLKSVLQSNVAAVLVTADLRGDQVYAETRLAPSGGISEAALMRAVRESFQKWPAWADEFIVDSVPDPSWRLLASRLPSMMRFVVKQLRFGISEGSVVANVYLPAKAVPQVTVATLLAMNTPSGGSANAAAAAQPAPALTVEEMLERKMSVMFDQESLEFAIDAIVGAFKQTLPTGSTMPPVRIIGSDLQLMGITQNQQVRDFSKSDLPLRTVLTDLVLGANPDKTATGPKDPKQALIWVVTDDPENPGKKVIFVTTRQAAENKYELPSEFRPAS